MKKTISRSEKIYLFIWSAFLVVLLVIVESISEASIILPFITTIVGIIGQ